MVTAKRGFTIVQLVLLLAFVGGMVYYGASRWYDVREAAYGDAMKRGLHNYSFLQQEYFDSAGHYAAMPALYSRGFTLGSGVSTDSIAIGNRSFYLRLSHEKTPIQCQIHYSQLLASDARNSVDCYSGGKSRQERKLDETNVPPDPRIDIPSEAGFIEGDLFVIPLGAEIILNAGRSVDLDGEIREYQWVVGEGGTPKEGEIISHRFLTRGTVPVTLSVMDDQGAWESASQVVEVRPLLTARGLEVAWDACSSFGTDQFQSFAQMDREGLKHGQLTGEGLHWKDWPVMLHKGDEESTGIVAVPAQTGHAGSYLIMFPFVLEKATQGAVLHLDQSGSTGVYLTPEGIYDRQIRVGSTKATQLPHDVALVGTGIHTLAISVNKQTGRANIFLDGRGVGEIELESKPKGQENPTFFGRGFSGGIGSILFYEDTLTEAEVRQNHYALLGVGCDAGRPAGRIEVAPKELIVPTGGSANITLQSWDGEGQIMPVSGSTVWRSSRPEVATIEGQGRVRGKSAGHTVIRAEAGGKRDSLKVIVRADAVPREGLVAHWGSCKGFGGDEWTDLHGEQSLHLPEVVKGADTQWSAKGELLFSSTEPSSLQISTSDVGGGSRSLGLHMRLVNGGGQWLEIPGAGKSTILSIEGEEGRQVPRWDGKKLVESDVESEGNVVVLTQDAEARQNRLYWNGKLVFEEAYEPVVWGAGSHVSVGNNSGGLSFALSEMTVHRSALDPDGVEQLTQALYSGDLCFKPKVARLQVGQADGHDISVGHTELLSVSAWTESGHRIVPEGLTWTSSSSEVVAVDETGRIGGVQAGEGWIIATAPSGVADSIRITIRQ